MVKYVVDLVVGKKYDLKIGMDGYIREEVDSSNMIENLIAIKKYNNMEYVRDFLGEHIFKDDSENEIKMPIHPQNTYTPSRTVGGKKKRKRKTKKRKSIKTKKSIKTRRTKKHVKKSRKIKK